MRSQTTLVWGALAAAAIPMTAAVLAGVRVHIYARRAATNVDPDGRTIVVFGSQALEHGPAAALRSRLDHALVLYRQRPGRLLAMAGGIPKSTDQIRGGHDEVAAMIAYAREHGVPARDLLEVRPGQNTREQVSSTRRLVIDAGLGPAIGVSSTYHLARICDEARRQGYVITPSGSANGPDVSSPRQYAAHALAEVLGLFWYALPQSVSRGVDTSAGSWRHIGVGVLAGRYRLRALRRTS